MAREKPASSTAVGLLLMLLQHWGRCLAANSPRYTSSEDTTPTPGATSLGFSTSVIGAGAARSQLAGRREEETTGAPWQLPHPVVQHQLRKTRARPSMAWTVYRDKTQEDPQCGKNAHLRRTLSADKTLETADSSTQGSLLDPDNHKAGNAREVRLTPWSAPFGSLRRYFVPSQQQRTRLRPPPRPMCWSVENGEGGRDLEGQRQLLTCVKNSAESRTEAVRESTTLLMEERGGDKSIIQHSPLPEQREQNRQEISTEGGHPTNRREPSLSKYSAGPPMPEDRRFSPTDWTPYLWKRFLVELRRSMNTAAGSSSDGLLRFTAELVGCVIYRGRVLASLLQRSDAAEAESAESRGEDEFSVSLRKASEISEKMEKISATISSEHNDEKTVEFLKDSVKLLKIFLRTPMAAEPGDCLKTLPIVYCGMVSQTQKGHCAAMHQMILNFLHFHGQAERAIRRLQVKTLPAKEPAEAVTRKKRMLSFKGSRTRARVEDFRESVATMKDIREILGRLRRLMSSLNDLQESLGPCLGTGAVSSGASAAPSQGRPPQREAEPRPDGSLSFSS